MGGRSAPGQCGDVTRFTAVASYSTPPPAQGTGARLFYYILQSARPLAPQICFRQIGSSGGPNHVQSLTALQYKCPGKRYVDHTDKTGPYSLNDRAARTPQTSDQERGVVRFHFTPRFRGDTVLYVTGSYVLTVAVTQLAMLERVVSWSLRTGCDRSLLNEPSSTGNAFSIYSDFASRNFQQFQNCSTWVFGSKYSKPWRHRAHFCVILRFY